MQLKPVGFILFLSFILPMDPAGLFAETEDSVALATAVAARTDRLEVYYYASLPAAVAAVAANSDASSVGGTSINQPIEITLLADVVLDEPLIIGDGVHIRLLAESADRTILRGGNNIEFPVIWVRGDNARIRVSGTRRYHLLVLTGRG